MSSIGRLYPTRLLNWWWEASLSAARRFIYSVEVSVVCHFRTVLQMLRNIIRPWHELFSSRAAEIPPDDRIPPVMGDVRILSLISSTGERDGQERVWSSLREDVLNHGFVLDLQESTRALCLISLCLFCGCVMVTGVIFTLYIRSACLHSYQILTRPCL